MSKSSNVQAIVDQLKDLTLLEAAELVKLIEETFGVSAAAPVAVASAAPVAAEAAAEEKTEFDVILESVPADKKIAVIKAVKDLPGIDGLGAAKAKVEEAPVALATGISKEDATKMKETLTAAGATVTLK